MRVESAADSAVAVTSIQTSTVGLAQPQQVIAHGALGSKTIEKRGSRLFIAESVGVERPDIVVGDIGRKAEDQLEVRIGCDCVSSVAGDRPDVDAFSTASKKRANAAPLAHRPSAREA